jgi:hypothetical protein
MNPSNIVMTLLGIVALIASIIFAGVFPSWYEERKQRKRLYRYGSHDKNDFSRHDSNTSFGFKVIGFIFVAGFIVIISAAASSINAFFAIPGMAGIVLITIGVFSGRYR